MKEILSALEEYGLSSNESTLYLACLKLGSASVYQLAAKVNLPKSTVYDVMASLEKQGLVGSITREKIKHFEAADPEKLLGLLEEKKSHITGVLDAMNNLRESAVSRPSVEMYTGKEGIRTILESVLTTNYDFLIVGNFGAFKEILDIHADIFVNRRIKKGIHCRLIEEANKENIRLAKKDRKELRETRFLRQLEKVKSECYIYGDNIAFLTLTEEEPVAIQIVNKDLANLMRTIFEDIWGSRPLKKKHKN